MKNDKPENMDDIYSRENLEYLCQYNIRSSVVRVLKENFDVKTILVISEKKNDDQKEEK